MEDGTWDVIWVVWFVPVFGVLGLVVLVDNIIHHAF